MLPMIATASAVRSPMPTPWITRAVNRSGTLCASPATTETDNEDDNRRLDEHLLVEQIGEFAPDGGRRSGGQERGVITQT